MLIALTFRLSKLRILCSTVFTICLMGSVQSLLIVGGIIAEDMAVNSNVYFCVYYSQLFLAKNAAL